MMRQQKETLREVRIDRLIAFIFHSECFLSVLSTKAPSFTPKAVVSRALVRTVSVDCDYVTDDGDAHAFKWQSWLL